MIHILIFNLVQAGVAIYAFARGGSPERAVGGMMVVAALASELRPYDPSSTYAQLDLWLLAVDGLLLFGLATVAVRANRFWPMWIAALQLDAVAIHALRTIDPEMVPFIYAWLTGQIAYPMMALLVMGTVRHRQRLAALGTDPDWAGHDSGEATRLAA